MLKVGIIGCGNIFTMHVTSCVNLPNAQLVAVCDIKADRAEKAAAKFGVKAYTDYKELIEKEELDVVHICVPHYLHPIISRYAIEHGVNVLCEKPMSIRMEDALENVRLAKEKGVKYGIIFQCRFNDTAKLVKENLLNGKLGKVISARVVLTWCKPDSYYVLSDWMGTWEKEGGGVLIDQVLNNEFFSFICPTILFGIFNSSLVFTITNSPGLIRYSSLSFAQIILSIVKS